MQIGYNGGWGEPDIGLPGAGIWNKDGFVGIGTTSALVRIFTIVVNLAI